MISEVLSAIQAELKAPKGQYNGFGNYAYRSCEDIMEALKPLLSKHKAAVTASDEIVLIGSRYYIKATARLIVGTETVENTAFAREADSKKGMDEAQVTGSASSYARKYALNGLFCIDDNKDADATNTHGKDEKPATKHPAPAPAKQEKPKNLAERYQASVDWLNKMKDQSLKIGDDKTSVVVDKVNGLLDELKKAGFEDKFAALNSLMNKKLVK